MSQEVVIGTAGIEALIAGFFRDELVGDEALEIEPDENLLTGGLVDSVGIVRLIAHVREELDVDVPPTDLVPENFRTVRVMAAYMQGRLESPAFKPWEGARP
jgi:acyl carrier protein